MSAQLCTPFRVLTDNGLDVFPRFLQLLDAGSESVIELLRHDETTYSLHQ